MLRFQTDEPSSAPTTRRPKISLKDTIRICAWCSCFVPLQAHDAVPPHARHSNLFMNGCHIVVHIVLKSGEVPKGSSCKNNPTTNYVYRPIFIHSRNTSHRMHVFPLVALLGAALLVRAIQVSCVTVFSHQRSTSCGSPLLHLTLHPA